MGNRNQIKRSPLLQAMPGIQQRVRSKLHLMLIGRQSMKVTLIIDLPLQRSQRQPNQLAQVSTTN